MGGRESQIKIYVLVQKEVARLGDRGREVTEVSGPEHLPLRPGRLENSPNMGPSGHPLQPQLLHSHKAATGNWIPQALGPTETRGISDGW